MNLDLRFPIGLMFSVFGLLLTLYGALSKPEIYERLPEKININLWWGLVLLVFGLVMLWFGWRGQRRCSASKEKK
jgi:hypothetical protein